MRAACCATTKSKTNSKEHQASTNGLSLAKMGRSVLRPYKVKTERQEAAAGTACAAPTAEIQRPQGSESGALRYSGGAAAKGAQARVPVLLQELGGVAAGAGDFFQ